MAKYFSEKEKREIREDFLAALDDLNAAVEYSHNPKKSERQTK